MQSIADKFWHHWIRFYLPELQKLVKWKSVSRNIAVGDLVMVVGENTPTRLWPLVLVKKITHGQDGLLRSVRLHMRTNELVRPITKIILLEAEAASL